MYNDSFLNFTMIIFAGIGINQGCDTELNEDFLLEKVRIMRCKLKIARQIIRIVR